MGGIYINNHKKNSSIFVYAVDIKGQYLTHNNFIGAPCNRSSVFGGWLEIIPATRAQWDSGPIMLTAETWSVYVQDEKPDVNSDPMNFKGNCERFVIENIATCNKHTTVKIFDDKIDIEQGDEVVLNLARAGVQLITQHGAPLLGSILSGAVASKFMPRP